MKLTRLLALLCASLALAACQVVGLSGSAGDACDSAAREYAGTVAGSFDTTVGAIRHLDGVVEPERWAGVEPGHAAVLCYIDAEIAKGPPPGPNGEIRAPFNRIVVGIVKGSSDLVMAGYRDQLPVKAP